MRGESVETWRVVDTGVRSGAANMALDEAMLEARGQDLVPNTLRFLQFSPPAVLVGYHQSVTQEIRVDYCQRNGIDINRRITGGGAIFFDPSQIGWEIIACGDTGAFGSGMARLSRQFTDAAIVGLRRLGIEAAFRPRNDIEIVGRKISGTGGTANEDAYLFQGTLLVDFDIETMLRALKVPVEKLVDKEVKSLRDRLTWLSKELGYVPPRQVIKAALQAGFTEVLGVQFVEQPLSAVEERLLAEKLPYFESLEWIDSVTAPETATEGQQVLRSLYKARGGLIRVALVVDSIGKRIKTAIVTGDFYAYPQRSIFDLEAALKDAPLDPEELKEIVAEFFGTARFHIPGITLEDMQKALLEALERGNYGRWGIDPTEAGGVFTVKQPLAELPRPTVLLLPYCAKLVDCDQRYADACGQCGQCSIGDAYKMGEEHGLRPISILNFEHLQETLERCREQGVPSFVGSCCEAFYAKHREDFEAVGVPGVLVDLDCTTCYDLGEDSRAYQGTFERQTHLRTDLLRRVMAAALAEK